jgi:hypothetical protein
VIVAGLRKSYGAMQAVRGVSFTAAHCLPTGPRWRPANQSGRGNAYP